MDDNDANDINEIVDVHSRDDNLVFKATTQLVKIINVLISCDIVYPKVMSVNF